MLDYAREHDLGMCIYDGNTVVCGTRMDRYLERETVLNGFNRVMVENLDDYRGMDMFKALALGADAVLIGWPETDSPEVADLDDAQLKIVREHMELMEGYIGKYSQMEHDGDLDGMTDTLIRITERVAEVRRLYQPDFPLPTFAEIRRVVQDEWDEDMGKIDPREDNPTAGEIEEETESADDAAGEGDQA